MKTKNIKETIREHFFVNPSAKLRVREIEKTLSLPLPSVIRYCKELREEGILTTVETGKVVFYTADRMNIKFTLEKRFYNIQSMYLAGLVDFLKTELSNPVIIVFGSYAKGEDVEESDIDLYVETSSKKEISLEKFEKKLKRKIQGFMHKRISEVKNLNLANNIINGVVLNGFLEVFK